MKESNNAGARKHVFMMIPETLDSQFCRQLRESTEKYMAIYEDVPDVVFTVLGYPSLNFVAVGLTRDQIQLSDLSCGNTAPDPDTLVIASALSKIVEMNRDNTVQEYRTALLLTHRNSKQPKETYNFAETFKQWLGSHGEEFNLGLFCIGIGSVSERDVMKLSSGKGYYDLKTDLSVFLEELTNLVVVRNVEIFTRKFSYWPVDHTAEDIPIFLVFTVREGDKRDIGDYFEFFMDEIPLPGKGGENYVTVFDRPKRIATRHKVNKKIYYVHNGTLSPYSDCKDCIYDIPYDFVLKPCTKDFKFKKNLVQISVSAYTGIFKIPQTIFLYGAGFIGKSTWIQTLYNVHAATQTTIIVPAGDAQAGKQRTNNCNRYGFQDLYNQIRVEGYVNVIFDLFGIPTYAREFVEWQLKGWIPIGFSKEQYDNEEYLELPEEAPEEIDLQTGQADVVIDFVLDSYLTDVDDLEVVKNFVNMVVDIDSDVTFVLMVVCKNDLTCPDSVKMKWRWFLANETNCPKCIIWDQYPYLPIVSEDGQIIPHRVKDPKIDHNSILLTQVLERVEKEKRMTKVHNYCKNKQEFLKMNTKNERICKKIYEDASEKFAEEEEMIDFVTMHKRYRCVRNHDECVKEMDAYFRKKFEGDAPIFMKFFKDKKTESDMVLECKDDAQCKKDFKDYKQEKFEEYKKVHPKQSNWICSHFGIGTEKSELYLIKCALGLQRACLINGFWFEYQKFVWSAIVILVVSGIGGFGYKFWKSKKGNTGHVVISGDDVKNDPDKPQKEEINIAAGGD